jgi:S1-C subfamily serine protease
MKTLLLTAMAVLFAATSAVGADPAPDPQKVADHLQDISVTIVAKNKQGEGEGSGVIKNRKLAGGAGDEATFVWTAAHVVNHLRRTKAVIDPKSGTEKTVVEYDDALVVKTHVQNGRAVGKTEFFAQVIRLNAEEDFAVLRVRASGIYSKSAQFYLEEKDGKPVIPPVGTKLLHVGSLLGEVGSNSMTEGIMSQRGRLFKRMVFDQTTVTAFPGSSGGGVYLTDGRLVGLVLRGAGETFNLIGPVRRMLEWSKKAGVEWAINDAAKMPTEDELEKLPVEDNGVAFTYSAKAADVKGFRTIVLGSGGFHLGTEEDELKYPTFYYFTPAPRLTVK